MPTHSTFDNLNGAKVVLTRWGLLHRWTCQGCKTIGQATLIPRQAVTTANQHAATCRANPR